MKRGKLKYDLLTCSVPGGILRIMNLERLLAGELFRQKNVQPNLLGKVEEVNVCPFYNEIKMGAWLAGLDINKFSTLAKFCGHEISVKSDAGLIAGLPEITSSFPFAMCNEVVNLLEVQLTMVTEGQISGPAPTERKAAARWQADQWEREETIEQTWKRWKEAVVKSYPELHLTGDKVSDEAAVELVKKWVGVLRKKAVGNMDFMNASFNPGSKCPQHPRPGEVDGQIVF